MPLALGPRAPHERAHARVGHDAGAAVGRPEPGDQHLDTSVSPQSPPGGRHGAQVVGIGLVVGEDEAAEAVRRQPRATSTMSRVVVETESDTVPLQVAASVLVP